MPYRYFIGVPNLRELEPVGRLVAGNRRVEASRLIRSGTLRRGGPSCAFLLAASQGAPPSERTPLLLSDAGVENVNAQIDALLATGGLRRLLAMTDLKFSNSMVDAWWRSLKHH